MTTPLHRFGLCSFCSLFCDISIFFFTTILCIYYKPRLINDHCNIIEYNHQRFIPSNIYLNITKHFTVHSDLKSQEKSFINHSRGLGRIVSSKLSGNSHYCQSGPDSLLPPHSWTDRCHFHSQSSRWSRWSSLQQRPGK